jgi:hypothetical protein
MDSDYKLAIEAIAALEALQEVKSPATQNNER